MCLRSMSGISSSSKPLQACLRDRATSGFPEPHVAGSLGNGCILFLSLQTSPGLGSSCAGPTQQTGGMVCTHSPSLQTTPSQPSSASQSSVLVPLEPWPRDGQGRVVSKSCRGQRCRRQSCLLQAPSLVQHIPSWPHRSHSLRAWSQLQVRK